MLPLSVNSLLMQGENTLKNTFIGDQVWRSL